MKAMLEDLINLIETKRPELAQALQPGLSDEALNGLEIDIPAALRELWAWRNGQSQSFYGNFHSKTNEMLMPIEESIDVKAELNELQEAGDIPAGNWNPNWYPFAENGGGNYMCLSQQTGEVFYFDKYGTSTGIRFDSLESWLKDLRDGYKEL